MRARHWLLGLLLFLFCSRRCTPEQSLKAPFSSREHQLVYLKIFVLFVGLDTRHHNYLIANILLTNKKTQTWSNSQRHME